MARNKKKNASQQLKKRQQKQQRRNQRLSHRGGTASSHPPLIPSDSPSGISPHLLADYGSGDITALLQTASDTEMLVEEPEFETIELDPLTVVASFISSAEEMGLKPDGIFTTDEQMQEILTETVQKVLTPPLRQEIVQAVSALRDRARADGDQILLKKAAAIHFILQEDQLSLALPLVGLLRRLVRDGVDAGFALVDISLNMEEMAAGEGAVSAIEGQNPLENPALATFLEKTLEDSPALRRHLEKQAEAAFEEGRRAILSDELQLHLYTDAELREIAQKVVALWAVDTGQDEDDDESTDAVEPTPSEGSASDAASSSANNNARMDEAVQLLDAYIEQLFTPKRMAEARRQLETLLDSPQYEESRWQSFLYMQHAALGADDALDTERVFLAMTLWSEIKPYLLKEDS